MKVDGRCHCGAITFEAEVDPDTVTICHCTDCQALTGSAYRANIAAPAATFVIHGEPVSYIKTAESGNKRRHAFCGHCGTPIYATAIESPTSYSLRVGTISQRAALKPAKQIWRRSALAWSDSLRSVPGYERQ